MVQPLNKTALPDKYQTIRIQSGSPRPPCLTCYQVVFGVSDRVFFKPVAPCVSFGREKGVCDELQRHPLIDPMFRLFQKKNP
jgi:hypothetical protein